MVFMVPLFGLPLYADSGLEEATQLVNEGNGKAALKKLAPLKKQHENKS